MKTFFKIFLLAAIFTSCDDVEPTIFHGDDPAEQTFLSFSSGSYSLPIERDAAGSSTLTLTVSTISTVDRTYNLEIVPGSADPTTYSAPASVTVPAGEYVTTFNITGQDNGLVDDIVKYFTLKISEASITDESLGHAEALIGVYEVCPLQSPFLGNYTISSSSAIFQGLQPLSGNVELVEGANQYERVCNATVYPGYGGTREVVIIFQCDFLNLGTSINTGVGCGEVDDEGNRISIWLQAADREQRAAYNTSNDASFNLKFTENARNACEAPSGTAQATFTKQ